MKKYLIIFKINFLQYFIYRLNFILWRFRNILGLIFVYFLWTAVYQVKPTIFAYTEEQLITYILLINIISQISLGTRTADIANEILSGYFSNYLLKPISFFKFNLTRELVDKLINTLFQIGEIAVLMIIFQPQIFIQKNLFVYPLFFFTLFIGAIISYFLNFLISLIAFWSSEIWAPRFIFSVLVSTLAGSFFPLDILPKPIYNFLLFTPFPYLIYLPTKIVIHSFENFSFKPLGLSLIWCLLLFLLAKKLWQAGIKNYGAYGR